MKATRLKVIMNMILGGTLSLYVAKRLRGRGRLQLSQCKINFFKEKAKDVFGKS